MERVYRLRSLGGLFAVPTAVVDKHIKLCSGVSLKALLLLLRTPDDPPGVAEIARRLGQSEGDTVDALSYWVEAGVLADGSVGEAAYDMPAADAAPKPVEHAPKAVGRPRLPRREMLEIVEENAKLKSLIDAVQQALGKPLTSADMDAIVALYTYYGLSAHFIMTVVEYCSAIGKLSMRYIEKTAASWQDDGITSEEVDSHVARLLMHRSQEGAVRRLLGIYDRALSPTEQKYIRQWCHELHLDPELIGVAFDISVMQTGKLSFAYMNKILLTWQQKGITDAAAARQEHESGRPTTPPATRAAKKQPQNKQSFDADRLEKLIEEKMRGEGGL